MRWMVLAYLVCSACSDHCTWTGSSRCDGDGIERCMERHNRGSEWEHFASPCADDEVCVDTSVGVYGVAVCSITGEIDERCPAEGEKRICIDDKTRLSCVNGYSSAMFECAGACVETEEAFCSLDATPSAACSAVTGRHACEGTSVLSCRDGYAVDRLECGEGETCLRAPESDGFYFCVSEYTCTESYVDCIGDEHASGIEGCVEGRLVAMTCNAGSSCRHWGQLDSTPGNGGAECWSENW